MANLAARIRVFVARVYREEFEAYNLELMVLNDRLEKDEDLGPAQVALLNRIMGLPLHIEDVRAFRYSRVPGWDSEVQTDSDWL